MGAHCIKQVRLAGRKMEKVKLCGREALAGIRLELNTHGAGWVSLADCKRGKLRLFNWEALADVRWEHTASNG